MESNQPQGSENPLTAGSSPMDCPGRPRSRRSSILKPPKQRNPLQVLDFNPYGDEEQTVNITRNVRRVSFASGKQVKEFVETANEFKWGSSYEHPLNSDTSHQSDNSPPEESLPINIVNFEQLITGKIKNTEETDFCDEQMNTQESTHFLYNASTSSEHCSSVKITQFGSTGQQMVSKQESKVYHRHVRQDAQTVGDFSCSVDHRKMVYSGSSLTAVSSLSHTATQLDQLDDDMDLTKPVYGKICSLYNQASPQSLQEYEDTFNGANAAFWPHSPEGEQVESGALDLTTKKTASIATDNGAFNVIKSKVVENSSVNDTSNPNMYYATLSNNSDNTMFFNKTGFSDQMDLTEPNGAICDDSTSSHILNGTKYGENMDLSEDISKMSNANINKTLFVDDMELTDAVYSHDVDLTYSDDIRLSLANTNKSVYAPDMDLSETVGVVPMPQTFPNKTVYADNMDLTDAVGGMDQKMVNPNITLYVNNMELTETVDFIKLPEVNASENIYADDMELTEAVDNMTLPYTIANNTVYADGMDLTEAADVQLPQSVVNKGVAGNIKLSEIVTNETIYYAEGMELTEIVDNVTLPHEIANKSVYADDMNLTKAADVKHSQSVINKGVADNIKLSEMVTNKTVYAEDMEFTEVAGNVKLPLATSNNTGPNDDMELTALADNVKISEAFINSFSTTTIGRTDGQNIPDPAIYEKVQHVGHMLLKRVPDRVLSQKNIEETPHLKEVLNESEVSELKCSFSTNKISVTDAELNFQNKSLINPSGNEYYEQNRHGLNNEKVCTDLEITSCTEQVAYPENRDSLHSSQKRCWSPSASHVPREEHTMYAENALSPPKKVCQREAEMPLSPAQVQDSEEILGSKTSDAQLCEGSVISHPPIMCLRGSELGPAVLLSNKVVAEKVNVEESGCKSIKMNYSQLHHPTNSDEVTEQVEVETRKKVDEHHTIAEYLPQLEQLQIELTEGYPSLPTSNKDCSTCPVLSQENGKDRSVIFPASLHSTIDNTSTAILHEFPDQLQNGIHRHILDIPDVDVTVEENIFLVSEPVPDDEYWRSVNNSMSSNTSSTQDCSFGDAASAKKLMSLILDASRHVEIRTPPNYSDQGSTLCSFSTVSCVDDPQMQQKKKLLNISLESLNKGDIAFEKNSITIGNERVERDAPDERTHFEERDTPGNVHQNTLKGVNILSDSDAAHYSVVESAPTEIDTDCVNHSHTEPDNEKTVDKDRVSQSRSESHNDETLPAIDAIVCIRSPPLSEQLQPEDAKTSGDSIALLEVSQEIPNLSSESPAQVTLEDTLRAQASRTKDWCIKELKKEEWIFSFVHKTLELTLKLDARDEDCENGSVTDIYFISHCTEKSDDFCKFVHYAFMQKFPSDNLKSMCTNTQQVCTLLGVLSSEAQKISTFISDFFLLQDLHDLKIKKRSVEFKMASYAIHALFDVSVDLSINWKFVSPDNINVKHIVGKVDDAEIKQLAKGIPTGPHFLRHFVEEVHEYVRVLEQYAVPTLT